MGARPLTLATFVPAAVAVIALPFGFLDEDIAVVAGVYGLYVALPAAVAWSLDRLRPRLPRWLQRVLGALALLVAVPAVLVYFLFTGYWLVLALPGIVVVFVVTVRLLRATPTPGSAMSLIEDRSL